MNRILSKHGSLVTAIFLAICLLVLTSSCAAGVSDGEYDQLESELAQATAELQQANEELASAKEERATALERLQPVKSAWQALEPEVEWAALVIAMDRDYSLWQAGEMTRDEYIVRKRRLAAKFEMCPQKIGNEELIQKFAAWTEASGDHKTSMWFEMYQLYINLSRANMEKFSQKLVQ